MRALVLALILMDALAVPPLVELAQWHVALAVSSAPEAAQFAQHVSEACSGLPALIAWIHASSRWMSLAVESAAAAKCAELVMYMRERYSAYWCHAYDVASCAAVNGDEALLRAMSTEDTPMANTDAKGCIEVASERGHFDLVMKLIGWCPDAIPVTRSGVINEVCLAETAGYIWANCGFELEALELARQLCVKKLADSLNNLLEGAARGGRLELMATLRRMGATDFDSPMSDAGMSGHLSALRVLRCWGGTYIEGAFRAAVGHGHPAAARLCMEWGAADYQGALWTATVTGQLGMMVWMVSLGANLQAAPLHLAAHNGHLDVLQFQALMGLVDDTQSLVDAAKRGRVSVVETLLTWYPHLTSDTALGAALVAAATAGRTLVVQRLLAAGARDTTGKARAEALKGRHLAVARMLEAPEEALRIRFAFGAELGL